MSSGCPALQALSHHPLRFEKHRRLSSSIYQFPPIQDFALERSGLSLVPLLAFGATVDDYGKRTFYSQQDRTDCS
jgi:hypothetical protein